jgi:hypothetical protein
MLNMALRWRFFFSSDFSGLSARAWQAMKYSVRRDGHYSMFSRRE